MRLFVAGSAKDEISPSARLEVKNLIKELKKKIPEVENHIFKSIHNVNIETLVGLKYKGKVYDFNELYKNYESEDNKKTH